MCYVCARVCFVFLLCGDYGYVLFLCVVFDGLMCLGLTLYVGIRVNFAFYNNYA